jgi:tetratricopeptide (TPR) repeat protein
VQRTGESGQPASRFQAGDSRAGRRHRRHRAGARAGLLALALAAFVAGCAGPARLPVVGPRHVELESVGFFPQTAHACGPAALATLLSASGIAVTPDALVPEVYVPGREGALQVEMLAALRRRGRIGYVIEPTLQALLAEVAAGRPVLVLQNLGVGWWPLWHYAVVVGFRREAPEGDSIVLRSGSDRRRSTPAAVFARTWQRSGNFGFVDLAPGEMPVHVDAARYFAAVAALESAGGLAPDAAAGAYQALVARLPRAPEGWFGAGNAHLARGDAAAAERAFARAIVLSAGRHAGARNNRVLALLELGCVDAARLEAAALLAATAPDDPLRAAIADTAATAAAAVPATCRLPPDAAAMPVVTPGD